MGVPQPFLSRRFPAGLQRAAFTPVAFGWIWLLFAAATTVVYRGLTQSLTIDESFVYHLFLKQDPAALFTRYDAAYHILHTWACWLLVHTLGSSVAVIRLPGMIAGLLYLAGVGVLSRRVAGSNWRFPVAVVLLSANPLIADYLSLARGYGAALAFFLWGFDALLRHRPTRAAALLALSVGCNLTFLVPAAAAMAVYVAWHIRSGELRGILLRLSIPFVGILGGIMAIPLRFAQPSNFYYGAEDLPYSILTLLAPSLAYSETVIPSWVSVVQQTAIVPLVCLIIVAGVVALWRGALAPVLSAGSLLGSLIILFAAHNLLGTRYPWSRTGLYLIWLFLVCCLVLWHWTSRECGWLRWLSLPFAATSLLLAAAFLYQIDTRYYYDYRDDAGVAAMMRRIAERPGSDGTCIGGTWTFEPTVNYYRQHYHLGWIDEMKRMDQPRPGCRFYLLSAPDSRFVADLQLQPLWSDPISGATLAESKQ